MSTPVFAATWDWGLLGSYVLIVLRIEHERNVPELGMVNDGELAVFVCWWAAAETDFLLFLKGVRSVHWEAKVRRSSSSKSFCATPKTMKGVLGFCGILTQFPVRVQSSHSSCISDIDAATKSLDAGTWNVSEFVKAEVVFAKPGWFTRFDVQSPVAVEKTCRAGPWNEAESEFEGAEDVSQAACGDSSSAEASKRASSIGSKVSNKALGEMKEEKRVQFFVKYGSTLSVVRSSSLDVVSDVLHLHADEYAVCGSLLMKMESTLSQNGIGNGSNVQVLRRLRGGAGAYLDIPGQWECKVCGATRCWPARKRCYRCYAPRDTVPNNLPMCPLGRAPPQSRSSGPPTRSSVPRHVPPRNSGAVSGPLRGPVLVLVLVALMRRKRLKQVKCCRL